MDTEEICQICATKAIGIRYGVYACNSCKKFFQRNHSKNLSTLRCEQGRRLNKRCDISVDKSCTKCRLERCIEVGMKIKGACYSEMTLGVGASSDKVKEEVRENLRKKIIGGQSNKMTTDPNALKPSNIQSVKCEAVIQQVAQAATEASRFGFRRAVGVAGYLCDEGLPGDETSFFKLLTWSITRSVRQYLPFATQVPGFSNITSPSDQCSLIDMAYVLSFFTQWAQLSENKEAVFAFGGRLYSELTKYWPELEEATKYIGLQMEVMKQWQPSIDEFNLYLAMILAKSLPRQRITDPTTKCVLDSMDQELTESIKAYYHQQFPASADEKTRLLDKVIEVTLLQRDGRQKAIAALHQRRPDLAQQLIEPVAKVLLAETESIRQPISSSASNHNNNPLVGLQMLIADKRLDATQLTNEILDNFVSSSSY